MRTKEEVEKKTLPDLLDYLENEAVGVEHGDDRANPNLYREVILERFKTLSDAMETFNNAKNSAYKERNQVVVALAKLAYLAGFNAGRAIHVDKPGEIWEDDWRTVVFIDLPSGQVSWHLHDSEGHLTKDLPLYNGKYDGHTTEQKYERLSAFGVVEGQPLDMMAVPRHWTTK